MNFKNSRWDGSPTYCILYIFTLFLFAYSSYGTEGLNISSRYNRDGWQHVTDMLSKSINNSVDPCQNFYSFVCGNYNESENPLMLQILETNEDLEDAFKKLEIKDNGSRTEKQAKLAYDKCKNLEVDVQNVKRFIANSLDGWPLSQEKQSYNSTNIFKNLAKLSIWEACDIFSIAAVPNKVTRSDGHMLFITQPHHIWIISHYGVEKMLDWLGYRIRNRTQFTVDVDNLIYFSRKLRNVSSSSVSWNYRLKHSNPINIETAEYFWPLIGWKDIFTGLAASGRFETDYFAGREFMVESYASLYRLNRLLDDVSIETFHNYMIYAFLRSAFDVYLDFKLKISSCSELVNQVMPYGAARVYLNARINQTVPLLDKIHSISGLLSQELQLMVQNVSWLNELNKNFLATKLEKMKRNLAYPEDLLNDEILDSWHPESILNISQNDESFTAYLKAKKFWAWRRLQKCVPSDKSHLPHTSWLEESKVNEFDGILFGSPYYHIWENALVVQMGSLQPPLLSVNHPITWLFGLAGYAIGHEMSHAIDAAHIMHDKHGNYIGNWLNDSQPYNDMLSCVQNQYKSYCYEESVLERLMCVEGAEALNENIADNAGLQAAYRAYKRYIAKYGPEQELPGHMSDFTGEQLFFMSFTQKWCYKTDGYLLFDAHAPPEFRVTATLKNLPEFAKAFKCEIWDKMNPSDRCDVW